MSEIPLQLKRTTFKFLLLEKKGKGPIEKWSENQYNFDDEKLLSKIKDGFNYGIIGGGPDNLVILDFDNPQLDEVKKTIEAFGKTFTIETNSGYHLYYFVPGYSGIKKVDLKEGHIDIRSDNSYVVGPNCIHPSGKTYSIYDDSDIKVIDYNEFIDFLGIVETKKKNYIEDVDFYEDTDPNNFDKMFKILDRKTVYLINHTYDKNDPNFDKFDSRSEVDMRIIGKLVVESYQRYVKLIYDKYPCGEKYREKGGSGLSYLELTVKKAMENLVKEKNTDDLTMTINCLRRNSPPEMMMDIMKEYIKLNPIYFDTKTSITWKWFEDKKKWDMVNEIDILRDFFEKYNYMEWLYSNFKNQILTSIQTLASDKPKELPTHFIQFKDCVFDIKNDEKIEATSEYFYTSPIPHNVGNYKGNFESIKKMMESWLVKNEDNEANEKNLMTGYELIAYCLLRDYPIQRAFYLIGGGSNGKGSFLRLISKVVGDENQVSSNLDKLNNPQNRFEVIKLMNKLVCQIAETDYSTQRNTSHIKSLTGGDLISGEIKNKNGSVEFRNFAKIITATNHLPTTMDNSDGFFRRFMPLYFKNRFSDGKEITMDIPEQEIEDFCAFLINILKNLVKNGKFSNDSDVEKKRKKYNELSNPVLSFIEKYYEQDYDSYVKLNDFIESFDKYQKTMHTRIVSSFVRNKILKEMGYDIMTKRIGDDTARVIIGLKRKYIEVNNKNLSEFSNNSY